jgi:hypothetical protein
MTTPAFFANWPTNASNSYRVTTNQTMIVALGRSFDDRGVTIQITESADESKHVQPNTVCYGCHLTLDPMRDFFKQTYSLGYFEQLSRNDPKNPIPATGTFAVDGNAPTTGNGIKDLARGVAQHPAFAPAWTQKLCQFANSSSCSASDPEFKRVADLFKKSNFNFKTLTKELFSSPLVTFASKTLSAEEAGVVISIARRDSLCAAIDNRYKLTDFCNLRGDSTVMPQQLRQRAHNLAFSVPGAGYARGDDEPLLPHDPSLFFVSAVENLCTVLSTQLVDAGRDSKYASPRAAEAMTDFVATLMGIPPADPRSPGMLQILQEHFKEAAATGVTASDALKSTFILACSSPPATSLGL